MRTGRKIVLLAGWFIVCGCAVLHGAAADTVRGKTNLKPGEAKTLATLLGPARITSIRIAITPLTRFTLRQTLLRLTWDDAKMPAVLAPLGDFFGTVYEAKPLKSPLFSVQEGALICTIPMPFRETARLSLGNTGTTALQTITWTIQTETPAAFNAKTGYFHALARHEIAAPDKPLTLAEIDGTGRLVGMSLALQGQSDMKFLEAMQTITVDGANRKNGRAGSERIIAKRPQRPMFPSHRTAFALTFARTGAAS